MWHHLQLFQHHFANNMNKSSHQTQPHVRCSKLVQLEIQRRNFLSCRTAACICCIEAQLNTGCAGRYRIKHNCPLHMAADKTHLQGSQPTHKIMASAQLPLHNQIQKKAPRTYPPWSIQTLLPDSTSPKGFPCRHPPSPQSSMQWTLLQAPAAALLCCGCGAASGR